MADNTRARSHRRLVNEGPPSTVDHTSSDQVANYIPEPKQGRIACPTLLTRLCRPALLLSVPSASSFASLTTYSLRFGGNP
jgi:hypothetical protein